MNIFITGATGFLGSNLVKQVIPDVRINKIYLFTRKSLPVNADSRIKYIKGDLDTIKDIVLKEKIDAVIHLAGAMRSDNFKKLYKVNVEGTSNVVEFCRRNYIRKLIFTSSVNVYLKHEGAYPRTKILAEDIIRNSGLEYCIFRLAAVYGLNDSGICRIIDFIRKYRIVPVFGDGKKLEQPIYIDEATEFLHKALFLRKFNITIDVCGKTSMSYNEMLILLGRVLNIKVTLFHIPVNFIIFIINFLTILKLPCPLTIEQIYHIDEDLNRDMNQTIIDFSVNLQDMESNLKKYITWKQ
jgi:nucleoside-diphosphate-sugar epimerase